MAENENKKKNTEGAPQGGSQGKGGNKPRRRPYGKGHHRPHAPRKDVKTEGAEPKQEKAAEQVKNTEKRAHKPQKQEHKDHKEHKRHDGKRREDKRATPAVKDSVEKEITLSPRRRQMQERLSAEQKAFAEATDIMLEAAERRKVSAEEGGAPEATVEIVGIRFKPAGKIYYFSPAGVSFEAEDGVIVETSRGQEYGFAVIPNRMIDEKETVHPLKPIVRKATPEDGEKYRKNKELEKKAASIWEELVAKHGLTMSLTDIEYTFDNSKLIFYFTAEGRVDFRELVKDLAAVFRTRIELRQIGVRDEAKALGGLGVCGMPFCCHRFLSDFVQVSIKMAKEQNLSLSSSKISGNCGRLMCCLSYEQGVYEAEHTTFPKAGMLVRTAQGTGVVTESNFLNNRIKVHLDNSDENGAVKVFTRDEVKVIGKAKNAEPEETDAELKALED